MSPSANSAGPRRWPRLSPYPLVLLLLSLFAWAPLLYPGYLQVHSGFLPQLNLADLAAAPDKLRWLPTVGVSGDLLRGDGPLAYWIGLALRPALSDLVAIKALFGLSILLGGLGMFRWVEKLAGQRAALLAAVVYLLWPPLLATVFVRGALGETLFAAILPWALNAEYRMQNAESRGRPVALVVLVALLFLAQPGLAIWATAALLVWTLLNNRPWLESTLVVLIGAALAGGLIWLLLAPASLSAPAPAEFTAHAIYPFQLFATSWGFGLSTPGWQDDLPLQLGFASTGLAILAAVFSVGSREVEESGSRETDVTHYPLRITQVALLFAVLLILLSTTLAAPLFRLLPFLARPLSYPWQLVLLAGPFLALAAGAVIRLEPKLADLPVWAGLVALTLLASYSYLAPRTTQIEPNPAVVHIFGDNQITLLDAGVTAAEIEGEVIRPSAALTVTLSWQALRPADFDYNIFIHALDENDALVAQWDGQPQQAGQPDPATTWAAGEIITGDYLLAVTPAEAGRIRRLDLGLYSWETGERLPAGDDDKVVLEVGR